METYNTIPCPRCHGSGIFYTRNIDGKPIPAKPDNGVCYLCNGAGTITTYSERKEGNSMNKNNNNTNTNNNKLKHIQGRVAIYSETGFTKEEQLRFLPKGYLLLDNSKEQPVLAYSNPYYGRVNPQTGEPNPKYTKESKSLHTLIWKLLLNKPAVIAFRYFDFLVNITGTQSIKDLTQFALTNGIKVQLHDLSLDYKVTLQPVQSNGQMQAAYWELLNDQLSEYNKLLKEHYQLRQLESYTPVPLRYYLGPDADTALDYITTWASAYEIDINFPTKEPETKMISHKDGSYTVMRDHFNDPKYYTKDIAALYMQLKYYEEILEPITAPTQMICSCCGRPIYIYDQSDIAPASVYYEALGNSGYYLERAQQVMCQYCGVVFVYDEENDEYLKVNDYEEFIQVPKISQESATSSFNWKTDPMPAPKPVKLLPDMDIFMEMLQAYQELHPEHSLKEAIEKTNWHYWTIYYNKIA